MRWISRATVGATSGPAGPTCSARSPTTSRSRAGAAASPGARRSPCRRISTGSAAGRENRRPVGEWARLGVRAAGGRPLPRADTLGARAAAGWSRRRCVSGLCELRRDPPLQSFRLLCAGGRAARGCCGRVRLAFALPLALLAASCQRPPPVSPHYVLGAPYQAGGAWYYPRESYEGQQTGLATVYPSDHAELTADGEAFDQTALAAAHQTLQLPAIARLTNLENGLAVVVRINDRGPATPHRLIEVTRRTATLLRFAERRRGARAAGGAGGGEPCGGRCGAGRAAAGDRDGAAGRGAAERPAAARQCCDDRRRSDRRCIAAEEAPERRSCVAAARGGGAGSARSRPIVRPTRYIPELCNTPTCSVRALPAWAHAS